MRAAEATLAVVCFPLIALVGCGGGGGGGGGGTAPVSQDKPDPAKSTITADRSTGLVANGNDAAAVTVTLRNAAGAPIVGKPVEFEATGGANTLTPKSGTTDATGSLTARLTSTVAETKTVSATADDSTIGPISIQFVPARFSAANSTVSVTPQTGIVADGVATATLAVTVRDGNGNPVPQASVALAAATAGVSVSQPGPTNASGTATGTVTSIRAGNQTIQVTIGSGADAVMLTADVSFVAGPVSASASSLAASPASGVANLSPPISLTALVVDAHGNPIAGKAVTLAVTGAGASVTQPLAPTDANGMATGTLSSTKPVTASVIATIDSGTAAAVALAPIAVTFTLPPPRFTLVACSTDNSVSVLGVDAATGLLVTRSYALAGTSPEAVGVERFGKFAYTANTGSNDLTEFSIGPGGLLARIGTVPAGLSPRALAIDPTGKFLYSANNLSNDISAYRIDPTTGALAAAGATPAGTGPAALAAAGLFLYAANNGSGNVSAFAINPVSGALTAIGAPIAAGTAPDGLTTDGSGRFLYVANNGSNDVSAFAINPTTGALSALGTAAAGTGPEGIAADPSGKFLYVSNKGSLSVSEFSIQPTGTLTTIGTIAVGSAPSGIAVDTSGKFVYVTQPATNSTAGFSIGATGALTPLATNRTQRGPTALAVSPGLAPATFTTRWAVVGNRGTSDLARYSVDPASATLTSLGPNLPTGAQPRCEVVHPSGKFLFDIDAAANLILTYTVDMNTGALTQTSGAAGTGLGVVAGTVDPSGRFLVAISGLNNTVQSYAISPTGALTPIGANLPTGTIPHNVTIDPTGHFVFVPNFGANSISSYTLDIVTGALAALATLPLPAGTGPTCFSIDPSGRFAYAANGFIDPVTLVGANSVTPFTVGLDGAVAAGPVIPAGRGPVDVQVAPSGKFAYCVNLGAGTIMTFSLDSATGGLTSIGMTLARGLQPQLMALSKNGRFAIVPARRSDTVAAFSIDPATGTLTAGNVLPTATGVVNTGGNTGAQPRSAALLEIAQ